MKLLNWLLNIIAIFLLIVVTVLVWGWWYLNPNVDRLENVVYAQRRGQDLSFDVYHPSSKDDRNHVAVMLIGSGGWKSDPGKDHLATVSPLIRHGYSVFLLSHMSQPQATVMEIVEDIHRATRYIRHHAEKYEIDPNRIGVTGGSSGGHLSLMLATQGGPGPSDAKDPIDRDSSAVQAAAIFFPVTDLLNLGDSTENPGDGGPPINYVKAFGPDSSDLSAWKEIGRSMSPIFHINPKLPPILIHHGNADTLVPIDQSQRFKAEAEKAGGSVNLVVRPGKKHGWITMLLDIRQFATWFDQNL